MESLPIRKRSQYIQMILNKWNSIVEFGTHQTTRAFILFLCERKISALQSRLCVLTGLNEKLFSYFSPLLSFHFFLFLVSVGVLLYTVEHVVYKPLEESVKIKCYAIPAFLFAYRVNEANVNTNVYRCMCVRVHKTKSGYSLCVYKKWACISFRW